MICINCFHTKTQVINSRPSKKASGTWRRRHCNKCGISYTTREIADLSDVVKVKNLRGRPVPYNKARLAMSLYTTLVNAGASESEDAYWLVETIEQKLLNQHAPQEKLPLLIERDTLIHTAYETLKLYHSVAGLAYGARYGIIESSQKRRPGRPASYAS